jgi:hypothetical protein
MGRTSSPEELAYAAMAGGFERRKQQRFECEGAADMIALDSGSLYHGGIKDLSLTGCYITGSAQPPLYRHEDVDLCLCVNGCSLHTPARVVVVRPESGAAFEFLPVDPEMRDALLNLIHRLAARLTPSKADAAG